MLAAGEKIVNEILMILLEIYDLAIQVTKCFKEVDFNIAISLAKITREKKKMRAMICRSN